MNAVDIIVIVVLLASGMFALMRGFVHEVLAMTAWAGAGLIAVHGLPRIRPLVQQHIHSTFAADLAGGGALFLGTLLVLSVLTHAVSKRVRNSALNSVDRSLGFIFGVARGAVLVSLAYMLGSWLLGSEQPPEWLNTAKTRPMMVAGSGLIQKVLPEEYGSKVQDQAKQAVDTIDKVREAEQAYRSLANPQPKSAEPKSDAGGQGYDEAERRSLERLLQSNQ